MMTDEQPKTIPAMQLLTLILASGPNGVVKPEDFDTLNFRFKPLIDTNLIHLENTSNSLPFYKLTKDGRKLLDNIRTGISTSEKRKFN